LTLEELQRSRPYFIGLIGEHYGRVVENIPDELLKRWPLLAEHHGRSTTELEIVCGVLTDEAMRGRGFFYFRDPKAINAAREGSETSRQSSQDARKLEDLKQSIRDVSQQGVCRLRENYRNVEELGEWILDDFKQLTEELGPVAERQPEVKRYDDDVMFTVYRPGTMLPRKWYSLLAFAHLSERRPDAPEDELDPLAEVQKQAQQILGEKLAEYRQSSQDSISSIPHAGEITFKPFIEGFDFNPSSRSFRWEESVHREEFKMRAATVPDGEVARGWLRVYLGPLILAQINLSTKVDSKSGSQSERQAPAVESARPFRKVFASYSHKDRAIVERIEKIVSQTHLGIEYLRDATNLRVGEEWGSRLMEMISEANAFQLFWSTNSMYSKFVREEYQYALSLHRQHFVLPVYWETPFPEKTEENLPPDELRRLQFENLSGATTTSHYSTHDPAASESIERPSSFEDTAEIVGKEFLAPAESITLELAAPDDVGFSDAPTDQLDERPEPWLAHDNEPAICPQCGTAVRPLAKFCSQCGELLQTPGRGKISGALSQQPPPYRLGEPLASSRDYLTIDQAAPPPAYSAGDLPANRPAAKKKSATGVIFGLAAVAFGFLIFIPAALIAIGTVGDGSSGSSGGGALLLLLLSLFLIGLLVVGSALVFILIKRRR
jgi:hypothetical protein